MYAPVCFLFCPPINTLTHLLPIIKTYVFVDHVNMKDEPIQIFGNKMLDENYVYTFA